MPDPGAAPRPCPGCGSYLARDNAGPRCSPCARAERARTASRALAIEAPPELARAAFAGGGVPAMAEALGRPLGEALDLALLLGLVPPTYRRRYRVLLRLLELGPAPQATAAEELGLSRWTVATYRRALGTTGSTAAFSPDEASPATRERDSEWASHHC